MSGRELAGIAHVVPQIVQLVESDAAQVDNTIALADWRLRAWSVGNHGAQGQHEATHVLVEGEKLQHLPRRLGVGGLLQPVLAVRVDGHILGVQISDLEYVEGDASLVSAASPLRIQSSGLVVLSHFYRLVQRVQIILLPPIFGILELREGFLRDELPRPQIPKQCLFVVCRRGVIIAGVVVSLLLRQLLEPLESVRLPFGQVGDVPGRPLGDGVRRDRGGPNLRRGLTHLI